VILPPSHSTFYQTGSGSTNIVTAKPVVERRLRDCYGSTSAAAPPARSLNASAQVLARPHKGLLSEDYFDEKNHEAAATLFESMVRGGEFHLVSKSHIHAQPPFFMRSLVGVFFSRGNGAVGAPLPTLFTLRPFEEDGIVEKLLDGYREKLLGVDAVLAPNEAGISGSIGHRRSLFVESLSGGLLASAIVDSLSVRYNDLAFRLVEHWSGVLDAFIHEQASALHQRHIIQLAGLADQLADYAGKLQASQDALSAAFQPGTSHDFFSVFTNRAKSLLMRAQRLQEKAVRLQEQYKTRLEEDRNWMVTALTLFTTGTWPLSFLTGYFGMCVPFRLAARALIAAHSHARNPARARRPQELSKYGGAGSLDGGGRAGLFERAYPGRAGRARVLALFRCFFCGRDADFPAPAFLFHPVVVLLAIEKMG
jgi:hypothetical protein